MRSWNDVEITGVLSGGMIGIVTAIVLARDGALGGRRAPFRLATGLVLGLLAGLIAVRITPPLDGCSLVKLKDSEYYLVWGTDGVLARTVSLCGLVGMALGALAQLTGPQPAKAEQRDGALGTVGTGGTGSQGRSEEPGQAGVRSSARYEDVVAGAVLGLLGGALVAGLPATALLITLRAIRSLQ